MGHFVKFDTYVKEYDNSICTKHGACVINLAQQGAIPQL